jgi:hypothetical protein
VCKRYYDGRASREVFEIAADGVVINSQEFLDHDLNAIDTIETLIVASILTGSPSIFLLMLRNCLWCCFSVCGGSVTLAAWQPVRSTKITDDGPLQSRPNCQLTWRGRHSVDRLLIRSHLPHHQTKATTKNTKLTKENSRYKAQGLPFKHALRGLRGLRVLRGGRTCG